MTTDERPGRHPLVVHQGAIGDTIQLVAMLRALHLRWGAPCDVVAGRVPAQAIFAGLPAVRAVHRLADRSTPYLLSGGQRELVRWLRAREPSPVYVVERWRHRVAPWSRSTRCEWLLERAGIPPSRRVTTERVARGPIEHAVDYFLRLAALDPPELAGAASRPVDPSLTPLLAVSADEIARCRAWLNDLGWREQPLILFQTTARRAKRGRWPDESWRALAAAILAERPDGWLLLVGAPHESAQVARLAASIADPRVREVASELPLRRLFALLTLAQSLVSLDTAPAHAAAALGCPTAVIVGTADPRRNAPRGPGAVRLVTAFEGAWPANGAEWFERHDSAAIAWRQVLDAWRELGRAATL